MQEPTITQKDPIAYYRWLRSQRMSGAQATQLVEQRFGPPTTPEERNQRQQAANENAALAQAGGLVGGAVATNWAMQGFKTPEWMKSTPTTTPTTTTTAQVPPTTATPVTGGFGSTAEMVGNGMSTPFKPEVVATNGDVSIIKTPTGGTTQVPTEALNDPGFMSSVNWNAVGAGAISALQAYQAYKAYQSGDKLGAGIYGAGAIASGAAAANAANAGFAGSQTMGAAAPYLGIAAGAYGGYQTAKMIGDTAAGSQRNQQGALQGASSGALIGGSIGSIVPGLGTGIGAAIGAVVGGAAGLVGSWTGSSKGKAQFMRDNIRKVMQEGGILDQNYQGTLADGTTYDFGTDGKALRWKEIDKISSAQPKAWNSAVPLADALASSYGLVGQKASDLAAWYSRAAVSNAKNDSNVAIANMRHFAAQQGLTYDLVKTKLDEAIKDNRISQSQYDYYLNGASQLVGQGGAMQATVQRPEKGKVARVSPGMYMNDKGKVSAAKTVRQALEINYKKTNSKSDQPSKKRK